MLTTTIKNIRTAELLFRLSLFVIAFYSIGHVIIGNIYRYPVVGAIYEMHWLPMLLSFIVIPFVSVFVFIKNKAKHRVYAALAILLIIGLSIILASH